MLTGLCDGLGEKLGLATASSATLYPLINQNLGHDHTPVTLARNLVFIIDPAFGTDGPLWSLNYEWYFYLLYPLIFLVARRSWRAATGLLIAMSALGFAPVCRLISTG